MMNSLRLGGFVALATALVALAGCATMNVNSFMERGVDVAQYRTYDWDVGEALATGDPRLDNNLFFQERVQVAVERHLAARGFEKTTSGTPELLVHYHASVTQRISVSHGDHPYGSCDENCQPYVYEAGTLVIDLVDARTSRLVWRGWAQRSIDGIIDNQDLLNERIDEAVARILERLPPGGVRGRTAAFSGGRVRPSNQSGRRPEPPLRRSVGPNAHSAPARAALCAA